MVPGASAGEGNRSAKRYQAAVTIVALFMLCEVGALGEVFWSQLFYFDQEFLRGFVWGWRLLIVSVAMGIIRQ